MAKEPLVTRYPNGVAVNMDKFFYTDENGNDVPIMSALPTNLQLFIDAGVGAPGQVLATNDSADGFRSGLIYLSNINTDTNVKLGGL